MSRLLVGVVVCLFVLGACGRPEGLTVAAPSDDPPTSQLAPDIPLPLDVSSYASAPCTLLRPDKPEARQLGETSSDGPTCTWHSKTPQQPQMTVTVDLTSGGLEGLYRKRSRLPYFEPVDVAGYPAVRYDTVRSVPDQGQCTVGVGVSPTASLTVTSKIADSGTLNYPVPCPDAELFATAVVNSITKG
jgi:hypothetical protein